MRRKLFVTTMIVGVIMLLGDLTPAVTEGACWTVDTLTSTPNDDLEAQWSPDGAQIAFVGHHEGNPEVYLLDVATKQIRNVSNAPDDDYYPVWSPDSRHLAFLHRWKPNVGIGQVWLFNLAEGNVQPVDESLRGIHALTWSPDSARLSFASEQQYFTYDVARKHLRKMYGAFDPRAVRAYASPDGSSAVLESLFCLDCIGRNRLEWLDTNTSQHMMISQPGARSWQPPSWSPDSARVVFTDVFPGKTTLNVYDVPTRQVYVQYQVETGTISLTRWSPDGRLAWVVNTSEPAGSQIIYHSHLFVNAGLNTPPVELLSLNPQIERIAWSPTRDQIAFQTYAGIYVVDVVSGVFHEFVQGIGKINQITWSPDGNYIAAHLYGVPGLKDGYPTSFYATIITDIRTGDHYLYGPTPDVYTRGEVQWSPDSRHLIFSSGAGGNFDIVMLSACS